MVLDFFQIYLITPILGLVSQDSELYWLFLLSSATMAFYIYWYRDSDSQAPTLQRFWQYCFPGALYRHPSTKLDLAYLAINAIVYAFFVLPWLVSSYGVAQAFSKMTQSIFWLPVFPLSDGLGTRVVITLLLVLAMDFGFFVSHILQHRIRLLWEFHKVHHSARVLTPFTAYRQHPVDQFVDGTVIGLSTGCVYGAIDALSLGEIDPIFILGNNAFLFLFLFAGSHLRHSHIWLSYGNLFNRFFISPAQHQIHHSIRPRHFNKNFGGIFAFWDRLFGTLYLPERKEIFKYGLGKNDSDPYHSILNLYVVPFQSLTGYLKIWAYIHYLSKEVLMLRKKSHLLPLTTLVVLGLTTSLTVFAEFGEGIKPTLVGDGLLPQKQSPANSQSIQFTENLLTTNGLAILAEGRDREIRAYQLTPKGKQSLPNGKYSLTNRGTIQVLNGQIVWDQFGGVQKFKDGVLSPGLG